MTDTTQTPQVGLDAALGLDVVELSADQVVARLRVEPHLLQPYGIVHGGVYCTVVETTASLGAAAWFGDRGQVVGVSNHTNFLRSVREGGIEARASPVHRGRTQQLWTVRVTDDADRLVAQGEVRLANVRPEQIGG